MTPHDKSAPSDVHPMGRISDRHGPEPTPRSSVHADMCDAHLCGLSEAEEGMDGLLLVDNKFLNESMKQRWLCLK